MLVLSPSLPLAYYHKSLMTSCETSLPGCFLWECLLSSLRASVSSEDEDEECTGTGQSTFYCSACLLGLFGFDNFTTHLETKEHALEELEFYSTKGVLAAQECYSSSKDATAVRLVLNSFREAAHHKKQWIDDEEDEDEEE